MHFPSRLPALPLPLPLLLLLCGLGLTFAACDEDLTDLVTSQPNVTITNQPGLYPEGIDYSDERDAYVVTSVTTGRVGLVDDDGAYSVLVDDGRILSAIGVLVDDERNRVLVAMSDLGANPRSTPATAMKTAMLGSFNLETGAANWVADLAALNTVAGDSLNFANDIAIDDQGSAYVTNSFSPYIYKVETNGRPSVFRRDARLGAPAGQFGANGIVAFDDYLLVAISARNSLLRLSLTDANDILTVELDEAIPNSPDGLERVGRDQLAIVANTSGEVLKVDLDDGGKEGNIRERFAATEGQFPTTAVERAGNVFVLYAYLNKVMMGDFTQASYEIERFDF